MIDEMNVNRFWELGDRLVTKHAIVIDLPKGSSHPRHPR